MAASPDWKVYNEREYIACFRYPIHAAMFIAALDQGEIRYGHSPKNVAWREGSELQKAAESYDFVAGKCMEWFDKHSYKPEAKT